jgi:Tfp pilus assembly protein PilO
MKALYSTGARVPLSRVIQEHRTALVPLALILGINLIALVALVLPLSQRVGAAEQRAEAAERQRVQAEADFKRAEALQSAKSRATEDLDTFYRDVLPLNVGAARRILQLKLRQLAAAHDVEYQGGGSTEEEIRDSTLLRLTMTMDLHGSYDDIRAFIYDVETAPDFVVIEQVRLSEATQASGLEVSLAVSTYYRAPSPAVQAATNAR